MRLDPFVDSRPDGLLQAPTPRSLPLTRLWIRRLPRAQALAMVEAHAPLLYMANAVETAILASTGFFSDIQGANCHLGSDCCVDGTTCQYLNFWFSQCLTP
ncbi:hypothetical protein FA95DRAFT_1181836 [Auriscalpium vulgare]|uniref:Uncharacterized protein n=1 Tax=Auriscalpium vulgare TaxID=40419 RepID=A0ACB8RU15_9AGAM|nr:hypothetical protein FA95DRAFT_1181836 [Auriscalpium vulgare]